MNENKECWICDTPMDYVDVIDVLMLSGKCRKYECPKCGEIIYIPLSRF